MAWRLLGRYAKHPPASSAPSAPSALACPASSATPNSGTTDSQVETLQQRFASGAWLGKTAQGDACAVYVKLGSGGGVREFDLRVSFDRENMLNGVPMPLDDRSASSIFYLNSAGATDTRAFSVADAKIDIESDDHSVDEGRVSHLRAEPNAGGFAYVEVST